MFLNKAPDGKKNICGEKIAVLRKQKKLSQRALAEQLQLAGLDISKNAIQQIETGNRFVTDIELKAFSGTLSVALEELLGK